MKTIIFISGHKNESNACKKNLLALNEKSKKRNLFKIRDILLIFFLSQILPLSPLSPPLSPLSLPLSLSLPLPPPPPPPPLSLPPLSLPPPLSPPLSLPLSLSPSLFLFPSTLSYPSLSLSLSHFFIENKQKCEIK